MSYLSKKLDPVAPAWPVCFWIIVTSVLQDKDADKIKPSGRLVITTPNAILEGTLKSPPSQWLSKVRLVHFHAILLNSPHLRYNPSSALNPATLLPVPSSDMQHGCSIVLGHTQNVRPDLSDILWSDEERIYFMDRSSVIQNRIRYVGAAVMVLDSVVWTTALLPGTSAQIAKLKALTQALKLAKGTIANSYTDSRWDY